MGHHDAQGPRVLKHPHRSRLFHWGLILGFMPAAITGFILWLKTGSEDFVNISMKIHIVGAVILTISALLYTFFSLDRIIAFIRLIFNWDDRDVGWMLVGGGYPQKMLLGKEITVPPMDKMNSGQKIFGICLLLGGILLIVTGWLLYAFIPVAPKVFIYWADKIHLVFGIFLGLFMFVHIFLGIYNWGEFKAMFGDGTQPLSEAQHHNPVWVEKKIEPVKNETADKTNVVSHGS
ncbi:cytochrome b/b6 domain-containing protein [Dendrosporobacter sp. 1207_IL3150]|uniref:cytochrome b/b6 domain-containing protein n=1 Tax=Dendrosporobacter sp. 1207_IL3150 TaxID=3084054 RepID=UPI002FDB8B0D